MSHFSVLVIGADVESQLAKYDENLDVEPYTRKGETEKTTYNPDSKWDWYSIGGSWTGYFKLKTGGVADISFKGNVDFAAMEAAAAAKANTIYDKLDAVLASLQMSLADVPTWGSVHTKHSDIDAARAEYWALPAIAALQAAQLMPWDSTPQEYYGPNREAFVKRKSTASYVPYAIVKDGEWMARGEMGWFGYSDDKVTHDDWTAQAGKLIRELPDDTVLTIVDCHI